MTWLFDFVQKMSALDRVHTYLSTRESCELRVASRCEKQDQSARVDGQNWPCPPGSLVLFLISLSQLRHDFAFPFALPSSFFSQISHPTLPLRILHRHRLLTSFLSGCYLVNDAMPSRDLRINELG